MRRPVYQLARAAGPKKLSLCSLTASTKLGHMTGIREERVADGGRVWNWENTLFTAELPCCSNLPKSLDFLLWEEWKHHTAGEISFFSI